MGLLRVGSARRGCSAREDAVMLLQAAALGASLARIQRFQALPPPKGHPTAVRKKANQPLALD